MFKKIKDYPSKALCVEIPAIDRKIQKFMEKRQNELTKPLGSLGQLEELVIKISGMQASKNPSVDVSKIIIFAGDHGVTKHGVSAYPQRVTAQMVRNFARGGAAINAIGDLSGSELKVVNVGIKHSLYKHESVANEVICRGTKDILYEHAMTEKEMLSAIDVGYKIANEQIKLGMDVVVLGEMGIGNTTAASAITSILCDHPVANVTGAGTGLNKKKVNKKINIIKRAICLHGDQQKNPYNVLKVYGGLEIAALVGGMFAAASERIPIILDGFIVGAAAIVSAAINPKITQYMIAGHCSTEPGHVIQLNKLGLKPILNLEMRLGEGSGAALALCVLRGACEIANKMATFKSARVSGKLD